MKTMVRSAVDAIEKGCGMLDVGRTDLQTFGEGEKGERGRENLVRACNWGGLGPGVPRSQGQGPERA